MFYGFEGLALVAAARADDLRAAQPLGRLGRRFAKRPGTCSPSPSSSFHDELEPEVRTRLGEAEFDRAWNEGRQLPPDDAMALALGRR